MKGRLHIRFLNKMFRKTSNKKGQIQISFGMIFSIILMILFIAFAIYAINIFLGIQGQASEQKLAHDIQEDIDRVWRSSESSQEFEYLASGDINGICLTDSVSENLIIRSGAETERFLLEHIDILEITSSENPYCIDSVDSKIKLRMEKSFGDNLVNIKRV